jgi:serine/threonine-protein kinase RsbW
MANSAPGIAARHARCAKPAKRWSITPAVRVPEQLTVDIALAVGEALANAVEHGNKDAGLHRRALPLRSGGVNLIEVSDEGAGFDFDHAGVSQAQRPRPSRRHSVRGFGITIMRSLMDTVEYDGSRGTVVRLRKRLGT